MFKFHQQIEDFVRGTRLDVEKTFKIQAESMLKKLQDLVSSIWPKAYISVYGSYATSLCLPSSDLDVVVMNANTNHPLQGTSCSLQI